jgi:cytochrome c
MVRWENLSKTFPKLGILIFLLALTACGAWSPDEIEVPGGNRQRGAQALRDYGCGYCHHIPGVEEGEGRVAMPLDNWGDRQLIAGQFPNNVEFLIPWIQDPPGMLPSTTMPNLGVSEQEARDMIAYLYTLRQEDSFTGFISSIRWRFEDTFSDPPPPPEPIQPQPHPLEPIRGWELYSRHCAECHRFFGEGITGSVPGLDANPLVTGNSGPLLEIVIHGTRGMPAFGDVLSDEEIGAILTFIRTAWTNRASPLEITR